MKSDNIDINGQKISYSRRGNGEKTIVLLHGNSACKEVFVRQFEYFKSAEFSLLALDLPGHGASDNALHPQGGYTIPGYAATILQALDLLGIKDHIIVGWSLGGNIALEIAGCDIVNSNARLKGMMIFGAPPAGPGMEYVEKAFLPATFEYAVGDANATPAQIDDYVKAVYGTLDPIPDTFYECAQRTEGQARERMVTHWMGGTSGYDQYKTIETYIKPMCVVHGNLDPFAALPFLKNAPWKNLWRSEVFEIEESGHAPFIECPDIFNTILQEFATDVF